MTSLRDLQTRMLDSLLGTSTDATQCLIETAGVGAAAGLAVYRNTVYRNVAEALHSTYPAVLRLVGEEYFRRIVRDFASRYPSRSGDLIHLGTLFPDYLAVLHGHDEHRYLGDVARLELLIQEVLLAPEPVSTPLDLARLAQVAPAAYDTLRFILHPALRRFESPYPARRIWESNVHSAAEPECLDLASGGDRLAVLRRQLQLQFHPMSRGEWCLLCAFGQGEPFAAAVEAAEASDGEFDAAVALQRFVALHAIVDFQ